MAQQQKCKFLEANLKREEGIFCVKEFFWQARSFFVKVMLFPCNKKLHKNGQYLRNF